MTRKLLGAVAAVGLLAACEARFGNDAGDVADNASAAGRAEEGRVTIEANGFNMSIDIPDFVQGDARIGEHDGLVYPGSDLSGLHIQGGSDGRDDRGGEAEIRFTHADPPERVAAWYRDPARSGAFALSSERRRGEAFVLSGIATDGRERFTVTIAPRAGGGSDTRLLVGDPE